MYRHFLFTRHVKIMVAVSDYQNDVCENTTRKCAAYHIPWVLRSAGILVNLPDESV